MQGVKKSNAQMDESFSGALIYGCRFNAGLIG
jgi:hypothetical protein